MNRFPIMPGYDGICDLLQDARVGEVYHVVYNSAGGSNSTPIARFFASRPKFIEGFNAHWRLDCFVREHALAPDPALLGDALLQALIANRVLEVPVWVSWHRSSELGGKALGEVFEVD